MTRKRFDSAKMQAIINRLKSEGRLPSEEEFLRVTEGLRSEVRPKLLEIMRKDAERKAKAKVRRRR